MVIFVDFLFLCYLCIAYNIVKKLVFFLFLNIIIWNTGWTTIRGIRNF